MHKMIPERKQYPDYRGNIMQSKPQMYPDSIAQMEETGGGPGPRKKNKIKMNLVGHGLPCSSGPYWSSAVGEGST